ncbi:MAG TPA: hemerythrin domain-containing protein [Candidatus Baltobacteraceae bacterium]|jgi:hypothetical protein|nr:hemerythrin domain-containing protein [Candidatus Baltobacteraceae bacterium]
MSEALNRSIDLHACRQHHSVLRSIIKRFPIAQPFDAHAAAQSLTQLSNVLLRHLRLEDEHLYPALERGDTTLRLIAARYRNEMGGLRHAFVAFCDRWPSPETIAGDMRLFLIDWATLRDPLLARMDAEDHGLYDRAEAHFSTQLERAKKL